MRRAFYYMIAAIALLLTACEHKELCLDHNAHNADWYLTVNATYDLRWEYRQTDNPASPDWMHQWDATYFGMPYEALNPVVPEGIRVLEYNESPQQHRINNLPPTGGEVGLTSTAYAMIMYNNDTEYILFDDLSHPVKTQAYTRTRTRASYFGNHLSTGGVKEITVNQPDVLFCSFLRDIKKGVTDAENPTMDITMTPVTYTYLIRAQFSAGVKYLALGRGALAGMASGCYLHDGSTPDEAVTILFDGTVEPWGVQAFVRTFGVPGYPAIYPTREPGEKQYLLNIEVKLTNGDIKSFDLDVTDQVAAQPRGGVIEVSGLEITDEEGGSKGSGFDVSVDDWGEFEDIPLPLM